VLSRGPFKPLNIDQTRPFQTSMFPLNPSVPWRGTAHIPLVTTVLDAQEPAWNNRTNMILKTRRSQCKSCVDWTYDRASQTSRPTRNTTLYGENEKLFRYKDLHLCTFT
jgi:hypothetical protein